MRSPRAPAELIVGTSIGELRFNVALDQKELIGSILKERVALRASGTNRV